MKTYSIIAAIAAAAASLVAFTTPAVAQEVAFELPQPVVMTTSRAAVKAEVIAARANGPLWITEASTSGDGAVALPQATRYAAAPQAAPAAAPAAAPVAAKTTGIAKAVRSMASRGKPASHAYEGDTGFDNTAAIGARVL